MGRSLTKIRLQYIHEFRDRHGKIRRYVRLPGRKQIPLRGAPGSEEFMSIYQAALAGETPRVELGASRTRPGTVNAAVISYFNSSSFQSLASNTRRNRRNILERFRQEHGDKADRASATRAYRPHGRGESRYARYGAHFC